MTGAGDAVDPRETAAGDVPAGGRGVTTIADRVVAKIAVQAAREALRSGPGADVLPRDPGARPRARVSVHDRSARVRVLLELGYPSDIGAQCAAVRRQVALRVRELVDMEVPEVAVGVERLHSEQLDGHVVGRAR